MSDLLKQYRREADQLGGGDDWFARDGAVMYAPQLVLEILEEAERLAEALEEAERLAFPKFENLEIRGSWLIERGVYPGDMIDGYGILPGSDAEPILNLADLPGWEYDADGNRITEVADG